MQMSTLENELLTALASNYEKNPFGYITLPKQTVDCSEARCIVADMRNQGYIDEQMRGVVRLTARGYQICRTRLLISA